jgi:epoxyqueuosine reductase
MSASRPKSLGERIESELERLFDPIGRWLLTSSLMNYVHLVPSLPGFFRRKFAHPDGPWTVDLPPLAPQLASAPGIRRNRAAEQAAFEAAPLQIWTQVHYSAAQWARRAAWRSLLPAAPRHKRAYLAVHATDDVVPEPPKAPPDPNALTDDVRSKAAELGVNAIGFAPYDPKYTFAPHQAKWFGPTVIVLIKEQNYELAQQIPHKQFEQDAFSTYAELMVAGARLASMIHDRGYRARAADSSSNSIVHHYAVEAGLGQMGLNGQLLTPAAGSRIRIGLIYTDAPLVHDEPRDFGIPRICDACQVCVRRCPPGAVQARRQEYRGVEKAKIRMDLCFPVIVQAHGCGICTKVCPVQKYGLKPVIEQFAESGTILGKGTDELEGYDWVDGRYYPAGIRPKVGREFMHPRGFEFDPNQSQPTVPPDTPPPASWKKAGR